MCAILHNAKVILFIAKGLLLHCIQASVAFQLELLCHPKVVHLTLTDFTLHFSCCFTKLLHSHFIPLLNNFTC